MAVHVIDTVGLKCPQPVLKVSVKATDIEEGDILEVIGDCSTFEKDLRLWAERAKKDIISAIHEGGSKIKIQIQF